MYDTMGDLEMKKYFCNACQLCPPVPKNCKLVENASVFKLIEYAEKTKDELDESLKNKPAE